MKSNKKNKEIDIDELLKRKKEESEALRKILKKLTSKNKKQKK